MCQDESGGNRLRVSDNYVCGKSRCLHTLSSHTYQEKFTVHVNVRALLTRIETNKLPELKIAVSQGCLLSSLALGPTLIQVRGRALRRPAAQVL